MAKLTGPLLSLGASGTVAKTTVFSSWRGVSYVRKHVVPANPQSTAQMVTRDLFSALQAIWKMLPSAVQLIWTTSAKGQPVTDRNLFTQTNIKNTGTITDGTMLEFVTTAKGGLVPASVVVTAGSDEIKGVITAPTPPIGFTVSSVGFVGMDITAGVPPLDATSVPQAGTAGSSPGTITLTGLVSGNTYQVQGYVGWTKPDGSTGYWVLPPTQGIVL